LRRLVLVLLVVVFMAATMFSAPMALAQNDVNTSAKNFFVCFKHKTKKFDNKKDQRRFLRDHPKAKPGRC
jgi:hypothetical protein